MDWLKDILGENLSEENLTKIKKELPKHFALKSDFNARGDEIKNLSTQLETANTSIKEISAQLETANTSIKEISAKAETSDALKADLEKINTEFETFKSETSKRGANSKKKDKLKALLSKSFNPDAIDLLVETFNLDDIVTNEAGEIVDGESKVKSLAELKPGLVIEKETEGNPPRNKDTPPPQDDYSEMTDEEYYNKVLNKKEG